MKYSKYILIIGIIACTVVIVPGYIHETHIARYVIWCVMTMALAVAALGRGVDLRITRHRYIFGAFLLYLGMAVVSKLAATNFGEWLFDVSIITLMLISFFLICTFLDDLKEIALPLVIVALALGVYGIVRNTGHDIYIGTAGRSGINMCNKNQFAQYLVLMLPFCMILKGPWKLLGILTAVIALVNLPIALSRAAIIALLGSAIVTAIVFKRRFIPIAAIVVVAITVFGFTQLENPKKLIDSESISNRLAAWKQTLLMTGDKFMVGAGNWSIDILAYSDGFNEPEAGFTKYYHNAHNEFLQVLAEKSIFGLGLLMAVYGLGLFYAWRTKSVWVFMGIAAHLVFSCFSYHQPALHLMLVAVFLGAVTSRYHRRETAKEREKFHMKPIPILVRWPLVVCLLVLCGVLYGFLERWRMERHYAIVKSVFKSNQPDIVIDELKRIPVVATIARHTMPYVMFRADAYKSKGDRVRALRDFADAYSRNPYNIYTLLSYGEALFYANKPLEALAIYEKALVTKPNCDIALNNISLIKGSMSYGL